MSTLNIKKFVGDFSRNLGNGIALGQNILTAVNHVIETGDTSILALMLDRTKTKKESKKANNVELTIRAIWDGVSIQTDKKTGQYRIKIKNATLSNSAAIELAKLVADETSVRSVNWAKAFNTETEPKVKEPKNDAAKIVKKNKDDLEYVSNLIHALQNELKIARNAASLEKVATDAALLAA
tara:strand:- start:721 stop:1266 length:546 start_codon:yes stop_codon:yes gene_type:complete